MHFDTETTETIVIKEGQNTLSWFFRIIERTVEWNKLTSTEQNMFKKLVDVHFDTMPKDNKSMVYALSLMFDSFLCGCGYDRNVEDWR